MKIGLRDWKRGNEAEQTTEETSGVISAWGYSYDDIKKMERERNRYRFALNTIVAGSFGKKPPRTIQGVRAVALRALVGERKRQRKKAA